MDKVITGTLENFAQEVMESSLPVLVDFWAPWCGHCTKLAPIFAELADELDGKVKLVKVNVEEGRALAQQHKVMSLPTIILFKDGVAAEKIVGFMPKTALLAKIEPLL